MDANFNFPMIYDPSGRMLAVLGNADGIGYELQHNDLSAATFTLPAGDPKRAACQPGNLVRLPGDAYDTGIYRIAGQEGEETAQGGEITYTLEHAAAALLDDVLPGEHDLTGTPLTEAIQYILDRQTVKRWVLGRVEINGTATLKCENTPLLTALLHLGQGIPAEYTWEFDCGENTAGPWTLNLLRAAETPGCGIHYGRSLTGIRKTVDVSALITRLYAYGAGTGEERTDLRPVNGGAPCIDADTAGTWGIRCGVLTDTGISDPAALLEKARRALEQYKNPYVTYTATAVDLAAMTGDPWDTYRPGKMVRVTDEEHGVAFASRIVTVKKTDVWDPASLEITIANAPRDALDSMTEMQTRADALNEQQNRTQTLAAGTQKTVTQIQDTIHQMAGRIDENTGNLVGVSLRLDGLGQEIELQAGIISAQGELISGAQVAIDGLNKRVESIAGDIDQLTGDLTGARELIDGANQKILEQAGQISAQGELISGAQLAIDGANAAITAEVKRASEAEGELTGKLEITTEAITAEVTRATTEEGKLAGRIKITEDSITAQAGKIDAQGKLISGAQEDIDGLNKSITDIAGDVSELDGSLSGVRTKLDGVEKTVTTQAGTISEQGELIEGAQQRIDGLTGEISQTVKKDGLISAINQSAEKITISASKVNLVGYVTATSLETDYLSAIRANFTSLTSGTLRATNLSSDGFTGDHMQLAGDGRIGGDLYIHGYDFDQHRHRIVDNNDGTFSIGLATWSDANSFKIADTKTYKDGVSAAKNSVRITGSWSGGVYTARTDAELPQSNSTYISGKASITYNASSHNYSVSAPVQYSSGPGSPSENTGYTISGTSGTEAYDAGRSSVTVDSVTDATYNPDNKNYTITINLTNGAKRQYVIGAMDAYNAGYSSGFADVAFDGGINFSNSAPGRVSADVRITNGKVRTGSYTIPSGN